MSLILASQSPRRRELLALLRLPFEVTHADVDESPLPDEAPEDMTRRLALKKALTVFAQNGPGAWVLGGDTTVTIDREVLGKPDNQEAAMAMLKRLSGSRHSVVSAVALVGDSFCHTKISHTWVTFGEWSPHQMRSYCDSGEPFDKAGGYGIQGYAGAFVRDITGSYSGVVGLPLYETRLLLEKAGLLKANLV
ncbi:MAG: nucleoside triphosphate pyrophosphatase [Arenicellales bacterium]